MEREMHNTDGLAMLMVSWVLNIMSLLSQTTITFVLGSVATVLAIVNYAIKIYQETKRKEDDEGWMRRDE